MVVITAMTIKVFIHAVNIHQGGGRKLLEGLLGAMDCDDYEYVLTLDERMPLSLKTRSNILIRSIKPLILQRLMAEVWLLRNVRHDDRVLCFGNLPPLFRLKAFTSVFLQNRYLIDRVGLKGFSVWTRLRITFERYWLRYAQLHANEYLVQTLSMQDLMIAFCRGQIPVMVLPFAAVEAPPKPLQHGAHAAKDGFAYVASGESHKNHQQLIDAWCLLAAEGIHPRLVLTVDRNAFPALCCWIDHKTKKYNLAVYNLGSVNSEAITDVYAKAEALIYPSTFESFGLPLIEAQQAGLPILAAELDYVRDVADPVQTFNPDSAISIAKAVKRFMGMQEFMLPMGSPASFMRHITDRRN